MKPLRIVAMLMIGIALFMTGVGGLLDIIKSNYTISKEHAWNDGMFLVLVAIAVLLLDMK